MTSHKTKLHPRRASRARWRFAGRRSAALVPLDEDHRIWQGGSFRDMNWMQRRPELYAPETDVKNLGNSK